VSEELFRFAKLRERLVMAFNDAFAVYEADKGKNIEAFNSGRYDGIKECLAILDQFASEGRR
jgi:hypothetical protein